MITIALRQHKGEEKVKNYLQGQGGFEEKQLWQFRYFAIIDRVARYIGHKPVPELGQRPAKKSNGLG